MIIKPFIWFSQYLRFFLNIFGIRRNLDPSGSSNWRVCRFYRFVCWPNASFVADFENGGVADRNESSNKVKMRSAYLRIFNESWLIFER